MTCLYTHKLGAGYYFGKVSLYLSYISLGIIVWLGLEGLLSCFQTANAAFSGAKNLPRCCRFYSIWRHLLVLLAHYTRGLSKGWLTFGP